MVINNLLRSGINNSIIKMVQSMLINRVVELDNKMIKTTKGTPQGGRASPLLWRIGLNNLLDKLEKENRVKATAFADDLVVVIYENGKKEFDKKVNVIIGLIYEWGNESEVKLNAEKTIMISIGRKEITEIEVDGIKV
jgi:retron-type reverse transcriptase